MTDESYGPAIAPEAAVVADMGSRDTDAAPEDVGADISRSERGPEFGVRSTDAGGARSRGRTPVDGWNAPRGLIEHRTVLVMCGTEGEQPRPEPTPGERRI